MQPFGSSRSGFAAALLALGVLIFTACPDGSTDAPGVPLPPSSVDIAARFATYLPAEIGMLRDVAIDANGDVYVVGGTPDLTSAGTGNTFVPTLGPTHAGGDSDVFVVKLDRAGHILWSRLLGGPGHDRAYAVELDASGMVYLAGRAGPGFATTPGAFQETFQGNLDPINVRYGPQDAFVAKFDPNGQTLWATYVGGEGQEFFRDIDVDAYGQVHGCLRTERALSFISPNAYQTTLPTGISCSVVKLAADGGSVVWATYLGSGDQISGATSSIRVDPNDGSVVVSGGTRNHSMPTTAGVVQPSFGGGTGDLHLARISSDGTQLLAATFIGGSGVDFGDTHNLAMASDGSVVLAATTQSTDLPFTPNAFQPDFAGAGSGNCLNWCGDAFIVHLSADFTRYIAGTYLGGTAGDGLEGVTIGDDGTIFVTGGTSSNDFPVTQDAYQDRRVAPLSAWAALLSPGLDSVLYSTLWSGSGDDVGLAAARSVDQFYLVGLSASTDLPLLNPIPGTRGTLPTEPLRMGQGYPIVLGLEEN